MATYTVNPGQQAYQPVEQSLVTYTHVMYGLHAFAVVMGVLTTATTVVGGFIFGLPSIVAVIMNYVKRSQVRGTWLESHFAWQLRTFWTAFAIALMLGIVSAILAIVIIGFVTWYLGALLLGVWIIYRVARGWMALQDRKTLVE
jgi:uncharacterized membrane protein